MGVEGGLETVLVTGGAGVIGRRLCRGLIDRGFDVRLLDRPGTRVEDSGVDLCHCDVTDPSSLEGMFDGVNTVFHLVAVILPSDESLFEKVNVEGTRNVVAAASAAGVEHFIYVSSASVTYPHPTFYSLSKREGERIVKGQSRMEWTIVRPTLVYDESGGVEFMLFLDYLNRFPVVPFIGRGRALKSPVHTDDIVSGLISIAGNSRTFGKTYNFSGGEDITIWDLSKLMLKHNGRRRAFLPIPLWICRAVSLALGTFMRSPPLTWQMIAGITQDANLDNVEASNDLQYAPIGVREGLQKMWPIPELASGGIGGQRRRSTMLTTVDSRGDEGRPSIHGGSTLI